MGYKGCKYICIWYFVVPVTKLCPTLWNPMDCSTAVFPILHYPPEFAQIHVRWVSDTCKIKTEWHRSSVTQLCPTLSNPMNCSTPGLPVHHQLLEHRLMSIEWVMPSNHLILCHPPLLPSASGSFPMSQLSAWGGQSIGASASASALPMNIQHWFPLELAGLISLQSRGLLRVLTAIQ